MAAKRFGAITLDVANEWKHLFTAKPNFDTCSTISFVNRTDEVRFVSMLYTPSATVAGASNDDYFLSELQLWPDDVFYIPGLAVESTYSIFAKSNLPGISVMAYGFEDSVL